MTTTSITFAKLAALFKELKNRIGHVPSNEIFDYVSRYRRLRDEIIDAVPELYSDLPRRAQPVTPGYAQSEHFNELVRDLEYVFEVRANSELSPKEVHIPAEESRPRRVFISHGRSADWRDVQSYIERDLETDTLELAQQPNRGRTVLQKLDEESEKCSFAVVVMTGDDQIGPVETRARENVLHEIGFFQGRLGLENVCLLHEEGTNIPSNIHGLVYIPFPKGLVTAGLSVLGRELKAAFDRLS